MIWTCARKCVQEHTDIQGKQSPEVGEDLSDVVATASEDSEEGVANPAEQLSTVRSPSLISLLLEFLVKVAALRALGAVLLSQQPQEVGI